ncbi:MAG: leucyl aminopeptidase [Myxococcaceae bacterium]|nr:leucyl aminopeptidase [Myxococcaceae bacterium]
MNFSFGTGDATKAKADALLIPLFDTEVTDAKKRAPALAQADKKLKGLLLKTAATEGFKGKAEQSLSFHSHGKIGATRIVLLGLGSRASFNNETLRLAAGRAVKALGRSRVKSVVVALPVLRETDAGVRALVEGFELGAYRYDRWRTTNKEEKAAPKVGSVQLVLPGDLKRTKQLDEAVSLGRKVAAATNWARDLVNEPAGTMTPTILAEQARAMAEDAGLEISIHEKEEIENLKMGMFLGVARGSVEPPKLVHLRYIPKDEEAARRAPICIVGKAITFDSGGLSLKPTDGMLDMKTDMAGSAATLGAMKVIAAIAPPFPVHAYFGACENMPSGNAYRLGDVLVSRLGKTVEITNTDAEGRLVLGDVLAYAAEQKPAIMVDLATLTGACMIALGHYIAGAFGDDDRAAWSVLEAARAAGEEVWRLPITELNRDVLKSEVADMKNSGERYGGAINAALFLKEFVGSTPWVHLDIAGPSQSPKERGYHGRGATGFGVRTLVELVRRRTQEINAPAPDAAV